MNELLDYLSKNKIALIIAALLSVLAIYHLGKRFGEFMYYIIN